MSSAQEAKKQQVAQNDPKFRCVGDGGGQAPVVKPVTGEGREEAGRREESESVGLQCRTLPPSTRSLSTMIHFAVLPFSIPAFEYYVLRSFHRSYRRSGTK